MLDGEWTALPKDLKAPFIEKQEASQARYAQEKAACHSTKVPKLQCRGSPSIVFNFLQDLKGAPHKIKVIEDIGFGWLLHLKCKTIRRNLCAYLVKQFNPATVSLTVNGQRVKISPLDVQYIFGVQAEGLDISEISEAEQNELYITYFKSVEPGTFSQIATQIREYQEIDDGFRVRFVLLVLGTLLCLSSGTTPKKGLISFARYVKDISKINWAKVILDCLVESPRKYHDPLRMKRPTSGVGGCLLFLELYYYEHFSIGATIVPIAERKLPRLTDWGDVEIKGRHALLHKKGGFGSAQLVLTSNEQFSSDTDIAQLKKMVASQDAEIQFENVTAIQARRIVLIDISKEHASMKWVLMGNPRLKAAMLHELEKTVTGNERQIPVDSQPRTVRDKSTPLVDVRDDGDELDRELEREGLLYANMADSKGNNSMMDDVCNEKMQNNQPVCSIGVKDGTNEVRYNNPKGGMKDGTEDAPFEISYTCRDEIVIGSGRGDDNDCLHSSVRQPDRMIYVHSGGDRSEPPTTNVEPTIPSTQLPPLSKVLSTATKQRSAPVPMTTRNTNERKPGMLLRTPFVEHPIRSLRNRDKKPAQVGLEPEVEQPLQKKQKLDSVAVLELEDMVLLGDDLYFYITDRRLGDSEPLVEINPEAANRGHLLMLEPREMINGVVINLVVVALGAKEELRPGGKRVLYMPTTFAQTILNGNPKPDIPWLNRLRIKENYLKGAADCDRV